MQSDFDKDLQSYFTDMEYLRDMFKDFVSAEKLPKRLIVLHGVGGVGKSSLLRMFRLHCKSGKIPVALASGDDAKSVLDVITRWTDDLKEDGFKLPSLGKTLETYRAIQAKVDTEAKKTGDQISNLAGKGVATIGSVLGSMLPGIGPIAGPVIGMGAEALTDWLRGFLKKPEIDLLLDPAKKLTSDFLEDLAKTAEKKRTVLLLDTYEQMSALEDWVGEAAQKIHPNVLMVIAGRKLPDWQRVWSGWMMNTQVEELKPMTEDIMRELIRRYYATMRGGEPAPTQVEAIIRFARGLPMVVTSAVQLWVKYGVEDFQSVKAEIVANLVDRLMEGVPSSLIPALEAAAVVRWFDQPILRAVLNKEDVRDVYNELRRFPFVRSRSEGLALHDSVREMMDENLHMQDSERRAELHEHAAVYFEKRLENVTGEEAERLGLERLYHRVCAKEETGIKLFQEMAEELTRYRFVNRLRILLNDMNTYQLEHENSKLWRMYYSARVAEFERNLKQAEMIYETIRKPPQKDKDPDLLACALTDLGGLLSRPSRLSKTSERENARKVLVQASERVESSDPKMLRILESMQEISKIESDWKLMDELLEKRINLCRQNQNTFELVHALSAQISIFERQGKWREAIEAEKPIWEILENFETPPLLLKYSVLSHSVYLLRTGRYQEAESRRKTCVEITKQLELVREVVFNLHWLGYLQGLQGKSDALDTFTECRGLLHKAESDWTIAAIDCYQGYILMRRGDHSLAEEYLQKGLNGKKKIDPKGIPLIQIWMSELYELRQRWAEAGEWYYLAINGQTTDSTNLHCAGLTGLIRVKHAQGDFVGIPSLLAEAEQLAQQYEYNDNLASLRLTQGHLAWENGNQDKAIAFYQRAMIYALRYNRFLLDELLSGRPQGTPLRPIVPYCLEHGEDGKKILSALRDCWKTGVNEIGVPRPDTISPIPEGIPLLEAEKIAREREPGDGSMQRSVIEQIEAVL